MAYMRSLRENGEIIELGGTEYRIDGVEGYGGSAVVYRASYQDQLNLGQRHHVLVKELYPFDSEGRVYRDEDGFIRWTDEAENMVALSRTRFKQGNRANLELLSVLPSQTSGNLNSYEAYGTYYSVLTLHGGRNLQAVLDSGPGQLPLGEAAKITGKILDALRNFHKNGLLHLDISPDNIILLPEKAMLIDYNSAWKLSESKSREFVFSEKEGYSAPEIKLQDISQIGYATDLYSVCACFYRMVVGRKLSGEEIFGNGLKKSLADSLEAFQDEPKSAVHKAVQIIAKGLHLLSRKRYQNVCQMQSDLDELVSRIEGKGVSHSALWESSRSLFRMWEKGDSPYLSQKIRVESLGVVSAGEFYRELKDGGRLLLKGPGGMGKTRLLREFWASGVKLYRGNEPVVYYIPLKGFQETQGDGYYIRRYIVRRLCFSEKQRGAEDAVSELERLFDRDSGGGASVILLLDGLNEAGGNMGRLLKEIENLGSRPGVGAVVTERSGQVRDYALKSFRTAELMPLPEETVSGQLAENGLPKPLSHSFLELLCNPMMLELYIRTASLRRENEGNVLNMGEAGSVSGLVGAYLSQFRQRQQRVDSGDQRAQLCTCYILDFLLPEIAGRMEKKHSTLLTFEELGEVARKNFRNIHSEEFGKAFPEYYGATRRMFENISDGREWFDYAVNEQLIGNFGLLSKTESGYYELPHDYFVSFLAGQARGNAAKFNKALGKKTVKGVILFMAAAPVVAAALAAGTRLAGSQPKQAETESGTGAEAGAVGYSEEQSEALYQATEQLVLGLGVLKGQLDAQEAILEDAKLSGALEEDPAYGYNPEEYRETLENRVKLESMYAVPNDYGDILNELETAGVDMPLDILEGLYGRPSEMKNIMGNLSVWLEYCMCDGGYSAQGRAEYAGAYSAYLEAYKKRCVYEVCLVRFYLDKESRALLDQAMGELGAFGASYADILAKPKGDIQSALDITLDTEFEKCSKDLGRKVKAAMGEDFPILLE